MSEWDEGRVFYSNQNLADSESKDPTEQLQPHEAKNRFREFIRNFRKASSQIFIYREQLLRNFHKRKYHIEIELEHLNYYDNILLDLLLKEPRLYLDLFERAAKEAVIQSIPEASVEYEIADIQVLLRSNQAPTALRNITALEVNRLLLVPGIIINASRTTPRATSLLLLCKGCQNRITLSIEGPHASLNIPAVCSECRGQGDYDMMRFLITRIQEPS